VTDPPYGLSDYKPAEVAAMLAAWVAGEPYRKGGAGFMGKGWDSCVPGPDVWGEALRVLKPGGYLLAFSGARTLDLMALAIRLGGFEIRDTLAWMYGSGFPKSLDVSKAIDKAATVNVETMQRIAAAGEVIRQYREVAGMTPQQVSESIVGSPSGACWNWEHVQLPSLGNWQALKALLSIPDRFDGLVDGDRSRFIAAEREIVGYHAGTTLAVAPGQGADRPQVDLEESLPATDAARQWDGWGTALKPAYEPIVMARKPLVGTVAANVLAHGTGAINVDGCRIGASGGTRAAAGSRPNHLNEVYGDGMGGLASEAIDAGRWPANVLLDEEAAVLLGEPSRFFYNAKASRGEREAGLEHMTEVKRTDGRESDIENPRLRTSARRNDHPTVKPIAVMRWLVRLVTPPQGVVLDPFAGSGTTLVAAELEGFRSAGIDLDAHYCEIAAARVAHWAGHERAAA